MLPSFFGTENTGEINSPSSCSLLTTTPFCNNDLISLSIFSLCSLEKNFVARPFVMAEQCQIQFSPLI